MSLEMITAGRVLLDGEDITRTRPNERVKRGLGYVPQGQQCFPQLTTEENLQLVADTRRNGRKLIAEMLALFPALGELMSRRAGLLSGGQRQRVGVARALAADPPLMLMDEPFGAVDAIVRATLQAEIARIAQRLHTTILFVTHDVDEALRLADRIVVMREGQVEQHDTPRRILTEPATPYVAKLFALDEDARRYDDLRAALSRVLQ